MTPEFFRQLAVKIGNEKAEWLVTDSLEQFAAASSNYAFGQMTQYFTFAFEKLSPTQRLQVAKKIAEFTES